MGHHYVPQRYQKGFKSRPDFIWLHDKRTAQVREVSIRQAAQAREFYTPEVEVLLATVVEAPTNPIIDKLTHSEPITRGEREQLALYVATMLVRVPARRRSAMEKYPERLTDFVSDVRQQLRAMAERLPIVDPSIVAERLAQVDAWAAKHATTPPADLIERIRQPWPSRRMVSGICDMTWRVLISSGPQYFITSDNPAFLFHSVGIINRDSELSFPLSTTHALHGCWQPAPSHLVFVPHVEQKIVREVNRRLASASDRAFYHEPAPWLVNLLQKPNPHLSKILWSKRPTWNPPPPLADDDLEGLPSTLSTSTPFVTD